MQRYSAIIPLILLSLHSCSFRPAQPFRVIPGSPEYFLRSPDASESSFVETLRRYNGFVHGQNGMDLLPGMELRIENAYYQNGMPKRGLNGYLGTEIARFAVTPNAGLQLMSVQPMKDRPTDQPPVQELVAESKRHFRYYRFYFEILFKSESVSRGSVLLGSDSADDLRRTDAILTTDPDSICGGKAPSCVVFPEACSVSVEMAIVVNGSRQSVVWGSPLSNVAPHPRQLKLRRLYEGKVTAVRLDFQDPNVLKLPLLPGDSIEWK